jgi:hypothetical protein
MKQKKNLDGGYNLAGDLHIKQVCKPKRWKPKDGEKYWTINTNYLTLRNPVFVLEYMGDKIDFAYWESGNCFRTKKQAERKLKEIKELLKK